MQLGRIQVSVPDVLGSGRDWAMPVRAVRRARRPASSRCRRRARRLGRVRGGRPRQADLGRRLLGRRSEVPPMALAGRRRAAHPAADRRAEPSTISDVPGAGGIAAARAAQRRSMIRSTPTGIEITDGQDRDRLRADGQRQQRRADGESGRPRCRSSTSARRACARTAARRRRRAGNPRVLRRRPAGRDRRRARIAVAGCPFQVPVRRTKPQPCVTVTWTRRRAKVHGGRAAGAARHAGQPGVCQSAEQIPQGPPLDRRQSSAGERDSEPRDEHRLPVPLRRPRPHRGDRRRRPHPRHDRAVAVHRARASGSTGPTSAAACSSWCSRRTAPSWPTALQFTVQAALQRWLGDLIELRGARRRAATTPSCGSTSSTSCGAPASSATTTFERRPA